MANTTNTYTSHDVADTDLGFLLDAWRAHEELREAGASVAQLFDSRTKLDSTRSCVRSNFALAS